MLCDKCKKNEATVHIKEFHNGKCTNLHLCSECAGESDNNGALSGIGFNLAEALFNFNKIAGQISGTSSDKAGGFTAETPTCKCGWNIEKIRQHDGKVGCPQCYKTFGQMIKSAIEHVQHGSIHLGKRPQGVGQNSPAVKKSELESLQNELKNLIAREEYEAAAICRDRINALKSELNNAENGENI